MLEQVRPPNDVRFDIVSLGEVMLRLDPGPGRIRTSRQFQVWEGGGEYNVARGLRRVFGLRAGIVTALADNEIGRLVEDLILTGGVDTSLIQWVDYDGVGRATRNGLNFTERGFGVRGAVGVSDRGHTAVSQLTPSDIDWDHLFGTTGVRWFHTGGVFAGLSPSAAETAVEAARAAKRHGTTVSYSSGGQFRAQAVNQAIAPYVDVMLGNEEDFTAALGFRVGGTDTDLNLLEIEKFAAMIRNVAAKYPNLKVIATTLRRVHSATVNDWRAVAWSPETDVVQAVDRERLEIFDRIGGGDSFASGLIFGLLSGESLQTAVDYGAAHGALAMTTPGDTSMMSKADVINLARGGSARVDR
jgi:2-dehydro-3-deoxygluconokinase